jgi:hypothetical protein
MPYSEITNALRIKSYSHVMSDAKWHHRLGIFPESPFLYLRARVVPCSPNLRQLRAVPLRRQVFCYTVLTHRYRHLLHLPPAINIHGMQLPRVIWLAKDQASTFNPMERSPSWEAVSRVAAQEVLFLWLSEVHCRVYVPPKRRLKPNELHGVISQKMILFITTAVKTSNPTYINSLKPSG